MQIITLKERDSGWWVNDSIAVPNDPADRYYADVQSYIESGGTVEPEFTDAELAAQNMGRVVSMRQARLALLQSGLLSQIESAIAALDEPDKTAVTIEWECAQVVKRAHEWVIALADQLGLTDAQLDDLFELAETL